MQLDFNPGDHEPAGVIEPLPDGWYHMRAIKFDRKPTANGIGAYVQIDLQIDENHHPEFANRLAWDRLNLWNPNQQAVDIARRSFRALCDAAGKLTNDTDQLVGITVLVKLAMRPAGTSPSGKSYAASNDVKGYKPAGNGQAVQQPGAAATGAAAGATSSAPPWGQKS